MLRRKPYKVKSCKICKIEFLPVRPLQSVCGPVCAMELTRTNNRINAEKVRKARLKDRKLALRSKSDWLKLCQKEFNAFIRLRDRDEPCISCGRFHQGQYHASHYRAVGGLGAPLRFNEINCHRACSVCNNHKSGNLTEYRIALVKKIGLPLVEWLEKEHPSQKWVIEDIKWLTKYYKEAQKQFLLDQLAKQPFIFLVD